VLKQLSYGRPLAWIFVHASTHKIYSGLRNMNLLWKIDLLLDLYY